MKKIAFFILAVAAVISCKRSETGAEGTLNLSVSIDETFTRAGSSALLDNAQVGIYMADYSGLVRSYKYSEIPSTVYLASGDYRVDVAAGEIVSKAPQKASWDSKSYVGSSDFTIVPGQITSASVVASVCNIVSNVSFDETVSSVFNSGYSLTIGTADDAKLTYTADKQGLNGYFLADENDEPSLNWTFTGVLASDGSTFTKSGTIPDVKDGKIYKMNLVYTVRDGQLSFDLYVDYSTDIVDDSIIFEPLSTGLAASSVYEIWARHALVHADVDETEYPDPSAVAFSYSADGSNWTKVQAERVSEGTYSARLTALSPSTTYSYKLLISDEEIGDSMQFTTEAAPVIPNGSFENVSLASSSASYYVFYDPSCSDPASQTMWWGSGNGTADVSGSASMGVTITVPDSDVKVDGARSVCLQSKSVIGMLAAGNLFTGKFMGLVGTSGGRVAFGRPWTSRPTALKLWVKYSTSTINIIKSTPSGVSISKSDYDRARIQCAIGTWNYRTYGGSKDSPVLVNTTDESTFVNYFTDPSTIAYGEKVIMGDSSNSTDKWQEIVIPLDYHKESEYPTHIIISCASSYYGDYFTGCDSSRLWIDKMELVYE